MTRYFTFSDDKSNKFWQITTLDTTFTVTFGRVGTAGQSQTKTFDTPDRCEQEAVKLVREKTGKGYVETVNGVAVAAPASARPKPTKPDDGQELETILNRYDEIIRNTLADELLPFLQSVDKRFYGALGEKIKEAQKYWCKTYFLEKYEYSVLSRSQRPIAYLNYEGRYACEVRGTKHQENLVSLSAMAILTIKETRDFNIYALLSNPEWTLQTLPILKWLRPKWLSIFPKNINTWSILDYKQLRTLEIGELTLYDGELFTGSIARYGIYKYDVRDATLNFLASDSTVLSREIPALFDYPVAVHENQVASMGENNNYTQIQLWPIVFARLLTEGKLDRLWFFERCLSVQTKDWPADLRSFYRKQIEANNPTTAEWMALQTNLFPLLAAQHPHVVSWAIGQLKTIHAEPDFQVSEMLDWAASAMMRNDCKTTLKTLLIMLERLAKSQPNHRPAIALLLADVFVINDLPLQTKAAQILIKFADPADADLQTRLLTYAGQMLGNVATELRAFLVTETEPQIAEESGPVMYQYAPPKPVQRLVPGQEVRLPETWNEFMFLIGKFIGSDDPLDMEILMNALIVPPADRPDDWREQLRVYEKKLEKTYFSAVSKRTMQDYLKHWFTDTSVVYEEGNPSTMFVFRTLGYRLKSVDRKRKRTSTLPLLSLPTHAPCWIDPTTLINRLLAYQAVKEPVDLLDLSIAIARLVRENTAEAISLCSSVNEDIREFMRYCLEATNTIELPKVTLLNQVVAAFQQKDSGLHYQALWNVSTRTFGPDDLFTVFSDTTLADVPNVVRPFVPLYKMERTRTSWQNHFTNQTDYGAWYHLLQVDTPGFKYLAPTLIYSNDLQSSKSNINYANLQAVDTQYWYSTIPQQPEALFTIIARDGYCTALEAFPVQTPALHLILQPGFQFREMSLLVLACGLLAKKRETGALAAEVLIHHFGQQTLDVARLGDRLGWLLAGNYAPVQRLTDALNLVRDVSPLHNKALLMTLDALFAQLAAGSEPPKNTKKLLELYLDLLVKLAEKPAEETGAILTSWQNVGALKAICGSILKRV